jgi:putative CocE/NonD family hydrolase
MPPRAEATSARLVGAAPVRRWSVRPPVRAELRLADGTVLVADIHRPEGTGQHPVLLMRQPYGRRIASTVVLAHPAWYAAHGYVVVVQDVRGTGESTGRFEALVDEAEDGAASLAWAAALAEGTGRVGLYGFSYQGVTQYLALAGAIAAGSKRPDAIAPAMAAWDVRDDWAFEGGAFRTALNVGWALQMAAPAAAHAGDAEAAAALAGPFASPAAGRAALDAHGRYSHFARWHADDAAHWDRISPARRLAGADLAVPCLTVGGLYDAMLTGTLAADRAFRAASEATSHLILGPWAHLPWNRSAGAGAAGPAAATLSVDRATVAFFDHYLKDEGPPPPPVRLYDLGRRAWTRLAALPEPDFMPVYLASDGLAAATVGDGRLTMEPMETTTDRVVHDPFRPAPLVGGALGQPPGFVDRRAQDDRADVAVYTLAPVPRPVELIGEVTAELYVEADAPAFDLVATLSLVEPDGRALVVSTGIARRLAATPSGASGADAATVSVALRPIALTVAPGQALRLSLQGAAAPAFAVNPGTGADPDALPPPARRTITLAVRSGADHPSRLVLPVVT